MAGAYNGPDMWGGGATWWEQVTGTSYESSAIYRANKEANSFYIPLPGTGAGSGSVGDAPTGGPGRGSVGGAPTAGPGVVRVGAPVGSGPGLGVITVGDWWTEGPLMPEGGEFKVGDSNRTPISIGGNYLRVDPGTSDGGDFEQRWGEFGGSVAGLFVMGKDLFHTTLRAGADQLGPHVGRAMLAVDDWWTANNSQPLPTFPSAGYGW